MIYSWLKKVNFNLDLGFLVKKTRELDGWKLKINGRKIRKIIKEISLKYKDTGLRILGQLRVS